MTNKPQDYSGPDRTYGFTTGQFVVINGVRFIRIKKQVSYIIPMKLIDKLREDEWDFDTSTVSNRKGTTSCA